MKKCIFSRLKSTTKEIMKKKLYGFHLMNEIFSRVDLDFPEFDSYGQNMMRMRISDSLDSKKCGVFDLNK